MMIRASNSSTLRQCCTLMHQNLECPSAAWGLLTVTRASSTRKPIPDLQPPKVLRYVKDFPERRKLIQVDRVPIMAQARKVMKNLIEMRGPELVHNKFYLQQYGIRALQGGRMHFGHFEMVRNGINRKIDEKRMFALWRVDAPWKAVTKKGQGHRMGGGKGSIHHYVSPVKEGRIIVELAGNCEFSEVFPFLRRIAEKLPFRAEAISHEMLMEKEKEAEEFESENINPFTFEYCVKNNMLGCGKWVSPYDHKWFGKHR